MPKAAGMSATYWASASSRGRARKRYGASAGGRYDQAEGDETEHNSGQYEGNAVGHASASFRVYGRGDLLGSEARMSGR